MLFYLLKYNNWTCNATLHETKRYDERDKNRNFWITIDYLFQEENDSISIIVYYHLKDLSVM